MLSEFVITSANLCQTAVPFIALSAYLPQWIQLVHTRSSRDISLRSWCIWTLSSLFSLFYAIVQLIINRRGWPLVFSTGIGLSSVIVTVTLVLRYRADNKGPSPKVLEMDPDFRSRGEQERPGKSF